MRERADAESMRASYAGELAQILTQHQLERAFRGQQEKLLYLHVEGEESFSRGLREMFLTVKLLDVPRFLSEQTLHERLADRVERGDAHTLAHAAVQEEGWKVIQEAIGSELDELLLDTAAQLFGSEESSELFAQDARDPFRASYHWLTLDLTDLGGQACESCAAWGRKLGYPIGGRSYAFFSIVFSLPGGDDTETGLFGAIIPSRAVREQVLAPAITRWEQTAGEAKSGEGYQLRVVDLAGNTVYPAEDAAAATDRPPLITRTLFSEDSPWKLELRTTGTAALEQLAAEQQRWGIYFVIVVLVMICGAFVLSREFLHQVEHGRLRSHLLSNMSHELKTPLSLIRLYADTLESGRVRDDGERTKFVSIISREGKRLTHLIDNLLDFQRIEERRKSYSFAHVRPDRVVSNTFEAYRFQYSEQGFDMRLDVDSDLPLLMLDQEALAQALINLMDNAAKYSDSIKEIRVHCGRRGDEVCVSVSDRGIGIPASEHAKIFQSFYRIEKSLVHDVKGSGLGLALVRHVAEAHGGRVELKSTVGKGSTFTICLPVDFDPNQE